MLSQDPRFVSYLGVFWGCWASIELTTCYAIGKFLQIPAEETHVLTAGMEFNRMATLLRNLVKRSEHPNKTKILDAINALQNDSKRNIFAHGFILSDATTVTFLERSTRGYYDAEYHKFTLLQFKEHVDRVIRDGTALEQALETPSDEFEAFGRAAFSAARKATTSPEPPKSKV
jgi:hypothetical protein